jgi:hypothetical protein
MATKFGSRRFNDRNEVHEAVEQYLTSKPAQFYRDGIQNLIDRWTYVVENEGAYNDD